MSAALPSPHLLTYRSTYSFVPGSTDLCRASLEDENRRLKKLLAESMLDNAALKDILGKNG
jgi:putative transposase